MAQSTLPHELAQMCRRPGGGKEATSLIMSPEFSVRRYHINVDLNEGGTGTVIRGEPKTAFWCVMEWDDLKPLFETIKSHKYLYLRCMNLVAEMRYAAKRQAGGMDRPFRQVMQNLAPTMREMKEYVGQLNVGQDAYTKLLGVYVELEEDRR